LRDQNFDIEETPHRTIKQDLLAADSTLEALAGATIFTMPRIHPKHSPGSPASRRGNTATDGRHRICENKPRGPVCRISICATVGCPLLGDVIFYDTRRSDPCFADVLP
jgi:hypothetical protein